MSENDVDSSVDELMDLLDKFHKKQNDLRVLRAYDDDLQRRVANLYDVICSIVDLTFDEKVYLDERNAIKMAIRYGLRHSGYEASFPNDKGDIPF